MPRTLSMTRRQVLPAVAALTSVACLGMRRPAYAGAYPDQTINFIVPDSGGGSFDAYVRKFSEMLEKTLKPSVNVEPLTMPGAGGSVAVFNILHDRPDGYTIGIVNVPGILTSQYRKNAKALALDKLTWIANLGRDSYGLAVSAKSPIHNIKDLRILGAKRPVLFSSTGFGSTDYFATRVFASALKLNFHQILGYTGSAPTIVAVARGDVDAVVHSLSILERMEKAGLVRTIFVFQDKSPLPGIDDATSIDQPDLGQIFQWRPIAAPPAVPPEIVATLSDALVAAAKSPEAVAWAKAAHVSLYPLDYNATLTMIKRQEALVAKWKSVFT